MQLRFTNKRRLAVLETAMQKTGDSASATIEQALLLLINQDADHNGSALKEKANELQRATDK